MISTRVGTDRCGGGAGGGGGGDGGGVVRRPRNAPKCDAAAGEQLLPRRHVDGRRQTHLLHALPQERA